MKSTLYDHRRSGEDEPHEEEVGRQQTIEEMGILKVTVVAKE